MLKIIVPCHGDKSSNLQNLISSIDSQEFNSEVECFFLQDIMSPEYKIDIEKVCASSSNKHFIKNESKKRLYAINNITRFLDTISGEDIIGFIDCDDFLWGKDCFSKIFSFYESGYQAVWTANEMVGTGINFSGPLNHEQDVYSHPWVSSHFKTFLLSDYKNVPTSNFKNDSGEWFTACYDQVFMLPIIHQILQRNQKCKYIDHIHYIYHGKLNVDPKSKYRIAQLETEQIIRSRGYIDS